MDGVFTNIFNKEIQKKIYGTEEHPETATTISHIAEQWQNLGEPKKALMLFLKVFGRMYQKPLYIGIHHKLICSNSLKNKNIEINKKVYPNEVHPKIASSICDIAYQWQVLGEYLRALEMFESALGYFKKASLEY